VKQLPAPSSAARGSAPAPSGRAARPSGPEGAVDAQLPAAGFRRTPAATRDLTPSQKAAIVIHLLNAGGVDPGLSDLPSALQARVTREIAGLGLVDRPTLAAVIAEFASALDGVGHAFPAGIGDVLGQLAPHLSNEAIDQLSAEADLREPALRGSALWAQVARLEDASLTEALEPEGPAIVAAALSRLDPDRAARLLAMMPSEKAEAVALAFPGTAALGSSAIDRIGTALLRGAPTGPPPAFPDAPSVRIGTMLNSAGVGLRRHLLATLEERDPDFAAAVRRSIFGFEDIPARLAKKDVPKVMRAVERDVAVAALLAADGPMAPVAEFILGALPRRMADQYRDEMARKPPPTPDAAERAMGEMIAAIRELEEGGDVTLVSP
jgi:flagellar motor switch protein FliG